MSEEELEQLFDDFMDNLAINNGLTDYQIQTRYDN